MEQDMQLPCEDKLAFNTQNEAKTATTLAKWQHDTKLKTYKCNHCGLWHLAS